MRFTALITLLAAASLIFAGASAGQTQQDQPQNQQQSTDQGSTGQGSTEYRSTDQGSQDQWGMQNRTMGPGTMGPRVMIWRSQQLKDHEGWDGPLRTFSQLESALDNPRIQTALGLTNQQVDGLRGILVNTEIYTVQTGSGILIDGIQLKQLLRSDHPDKSAVMDKGNAISQSVSQLINHYLDAILEAKNILTPQQQDMIRRYMEMRGHGMGGPASGGSGMGAPRSQTQHQW
jgi:hypothetical protein